jgi:small GTP-binding protein
MSIFKVVVVGDPWVGKTTLINCSDGSVFDDSLLTTIGISKVKQLQYENNIRRITLELWDTPGSTVYQSLLPYSLRNASAVIFCFSLSGIDSFENITKWESIITRNCSQAIKFFLVGTKADLEPHTVGRTAANQCAEDIGASYFETSAKTGYGVKELFRSIAESPGMLDLGLGSSNSLLESAVPSNFQNSHNCC